MKASLKQNFITNENLNDNLFYNSLAEELNKIIEEELNKSYEEINAEIIDDCCLALNAIYELQNGESEIGDNIININNVIKKYNLKQRKKLVVSAACAAVAVFTAGTTMFALGNKTILVESELIKSAVGRFEEIFNRKEPATEPTTAETTLPETTEPTTQHTVIQQTTEAPVTGITREIKNITVIAPPGFNSMFESVDDISLKQFCISLNYVNGEKKVIPVSEGSYEICEPQSDGTTEIKFYHEGFTASYYVTVIPEEKQNPVTVTSIYGTFANAYTVEDMSVIAVFSDGTEKWIPKTDCTITTEEFSDGDEAGIIVTVKYENCSFQFLSE